MTDAKRAATAADAIADHLRKARTSLRNALNSVEQLEGQLSQAVGDARQLNEQALSLATDPALVPAEPQPGEPSAAQREAEWDRRDRLGGRLAAVRGHAEQLSEQLQEAQRSLYGPDNHAVQHIATAELASCENALTVADSALADLRQIDGHDGKAVDTLQERASLLRSAVERSRSLLETVGTKLENARTSLAGLYRGDDLSTDKGPAALARKIAAAGTSVTTEIGMAQRETARVEGRLDLVQKPARDAARDSAELAALKGLNPPVPEDQRTDPLSSQGDTAAPAGRERASGKGGAEL